MQPTLKPHNPNSEPLFVAEAPRLRVQVEPEHFAEAEPPLLGEVEPPVRAMLLHWRDPAHADTNTITIATASMQKASYQGLWSSRWVFMAFRHILHARMIHTWQACKYIQLLSLHGLMRRLRHGFFFDCIRVLRCRMHINIYIYTLSIMFLMLSL